MVLVLLSWKNMDRPLCPGYSYSPWRESHDTQDKLICRPVTVFSPPAMACGSLCPITIAAGSHPGLAGWQPAKSGVLLILRQGLPALQTMFCQYCTTVVTACQCSANMCKMQRPRHPDDLTRTMYTSCPPPLFAGADTVLE